MSEEFRDNPIAWCDYLKSLPGASVDKTVDRIDPDRGDEHGNFRWATRKQQSRNLRTVPRCADGHTSIRESAEEKCPQIPSDYVAKVVSGIRKGKVRKVFRKKGTLLYDYYVSYLGDRMRLVEFAERIGQKDRYLDIIDLVLSGESPENVAEALRHR